MERADGERCDIMIEAIAATVKEVASKVGISETVGKSKIDGLSPREVLKNEKSNFPDFLSNKTETLSDNLTKELDGVSTNEETVKEKSSFPDCLDKDIEKNSEGIERMHTRNENLEGKVHPETNVPFERKVVENSEGKPVEGVFPKFDSAFDAHLPEELHQATDAEQFSECNKQLKDAVQKDPELKARFTNEQLEQIMNDDTPDGYTWHHDAEKGKVQLVDSKIHAETGHTGGKVIWGGGNENR